MVQTEPGKREPLVQRNWRTRTLEKAVSSKLCSEREAYECAQ